MKIRDGFIKREVMGQIVAVPTGAAADAFKGMVKLNETASFIWDCFAKGMEADQVVEAVLAEYEVPREQVEEDVRSLIRQMQKAGIAE